MRPSLRSPAPPDMKASRGSRRRPARRLSFSAATSPRRRSHHMKSRPIFVLGLALLATGCEERSPSSSSTPAGTPATGAVQAAKDRVSSAAASAAAAFREQRDKLAATAQTTLDDLKKQVDD